MSHWVASPAYGRDFDNPNEAIKNFKDGKDWICHATPDGPGGGMYFSIRDVAEGEVVNLRYEGRSQVVPYTVTMEDKT